MNEAFRSANCSTCRTPTPSVPPPVSWSPAVLGGARVWTCPDCARDNIRSIEVRLDPAWW